MLKSFERKGLWATMLGVVLALLTIVFIVIDYYSGDLSVKAVVYYCLLGIAAGFIILPSSVKAKISKDGVDVEVVD